MQYDYFTKITFANKKIKVFIHINKAKDDEGYHYNVELQTKEPISGDEFQRLKKYLEDEGYIDEAMKNFKDLNHEQI